VQFIAESIIRTTPERLFAFHELPDALARLTPPWEHLRIVQSAVSLRPGSLTVVEVRVAPLVWIHMEALHTVYDPPRLFEDELVKGPFRNWRHRHAITPDGAGARLTDSIEFEPPLGVAGRWVAPWLILPRLRRLFAYRHEVTRAWCEQEASAPAVPGYGAGS
jgi:ligand-binding SRPBCC domain-containing protein